jgi:outer membrane receptor protein involved in Fe transport
MAALLFTVILVLGAGSQAAPVAIRGIVVDATGRPLPGATVTVDGSDVRPVMTARDGRFVITVPAMSERRLTVTLAGFQSAAAVVAVGPVEDRTPGEVHVTLLPSAFSETVSVTATRGGGRLEGAAPVTAIAAADLQLAASPALDDVLRTVPGFSLFRRTSSRTANPTAQGASLRGVSASGASRALVMADGAPLNDPFGGWVYWDRVPQAAIDRVEVVRGGTSDLYGADALSGVVQVLTRRPRSPTLAATLEGASYATPRASIFTGTAATGWSAFLAGEASRTEGTWVVASEDRGPVDTRAGVDFMSGLAGAAIERPAGWSLRVRVDALGESRENGTPVQTNSTDLRQGRADATAPLGGGRLEVYGQIGDQVYRQAFSAVSATRTAETLTVRQRVPASQVGYGATWRRLFGAVDVLAGAETREIVATNGETAYFPDGRVRATTDSRGFQRSSGGFAQVRASVSARTTVVAGLRGDLWQRERGDGGMGVVSPRLSVSHRAFDGVTLRGAFTSSFRAPTLNERYRGFRVGNALTLPNAALEPERLVGGEGAVLWEVPRGTLRVTLFASSLDEAITNVTLSATPQLITRQRQNAGVVQARGLEAEGEYRASPAVTFVTSLALTRSRFVDTPGLSGNRVPQVPVWQGTAGARWLAPGALTVQAMVRAFGDQFEDDRNTLVLRQAALVDVSLTRRIGRGLAAFAAIENLLDTEYDTGRTPTRTIGTPVTVRLGARVFLP